MSYISITFLAFVSIMFLLYFLLPKRMQWVVLLLSIAPISLLSADAAAGATPISFTAPEQ